MPFDPSKNNVNNIGGYGNPYSTNNQCTPGKKKTKYVVIGIVSALILLAGFIATIMVTGSVRNKGGVDSAVSDAELTEIEIFDIEKKEK